MPVLIMLLGIALLIFGIVSSGTGKAEDTDTENEEERLAELFSMIDGVGECHVMITYTTERVGYGSEVVRHVEGVAVLCTGGDDPSVKKRITEMTSALYDIGANRVRVEKLW